MTELDVPSLQHAIERRRSDLIERFARFRYELRARVDPRVYIRARARAAVSFMIGLVAGYVWWGLRR